MGLNIKLMFCKKLFWKQSRQRLFFGLWFRQYWIICKLLWYCCTHLMIYYCTFCFTIRISEDSMLLEKLLSKIKLFTFFLQIMGLIHLKLLEIWHFIIVIHSPIHSEHTPQDSGSCLHSPRQFVLCQETCNILYMHKYCEKVPTHPDIVYIIYSSLGVDTSYAGW